MPIFTPYPPIATCFHPVQSVQTAGTRVVIGLQRTGSPGADPVQLTAPGAGVGND